MANTPNLGIPYPDNYADPADTPAALEAAMLKVDQLIPQRARVYVQTEQPTGAVPGDIWVQP